VPEPTAAPPSRALRLPASKVRWPSWSGELVVVGSRWAATTVWRELLQAITIGGGPLCGHQLRYLIKSAHGDVGAAASARRPGGGGAGPVDRLGEKARRRTCIDR